MAHSIYAHKRHGLAIAERYSVPLTVKNLKSLRNLLLLLLLITCFEGR